MTWIEKALESRWGIDFFDWKSILEGSGNLSGRFLEGFEGLLGRFFYIFGYLF